MSFCRISPSVGDSSGGPGGSLAVWRGGGSHHHLPHLETGKEKKQSWWVAFKMYFELAMKLSSIKLLLYQKVCQMSHSLSVFDEHGQSHSISSSSSSS